MKAVIALLFATCLTGQVVLNVTPLVVSPAQRDEAPVITLVEPIQVPAEYLAAILQLMFPKAVVELTDMSFQTVELVWMQEYTKWWVEYCAKEKIVYTPATFDCEDYARLYAALAAKQAAAEGTTGHGIMVGTIYLVLCIDYGFGRSVVGAHAINFFGTPDDLYFVEPQSGEIIPFEKFPHPEDVFVVKLGA